MINLTRRLFLKLVSAFALCPTIRKSPSVKTAPLEYPRTMKLPPNVKAQIEQWFDVEWGVISLETAKKLSETILRQYELMGPKKCVTLMIVFDPDGEDYLNEKDWHFWSASGWL